MRPAAMPASAARDFGRRDPDQSHAPIPGGVRRDEADISSSGTRGIKPCLIKQAVGREARFNLAGWSGCFEQESWAAAGLQLQLVSFFLLFYSEVRTPYKKHGRALKSIPNVREGFCYAQNFFE
jgi:hypothetical protein